MEPPTSSINIKLKPGAVPRNARVRPLNHMQEADLRRQLDDWPAAGIIEPTCSEWGAALVPIRKKGTDKLRWEIKTAERRQGKRFLPTFPHRQ